MTSDQPATSSTAAIFLRYREFAVFEDLGVVFLQALVHTGLGEMLRAFRILDSQRKRAGLAQKPRSILTILWMRKPDRNGSIVAFRAFERFENTA